MTPPVASPQILCKWRNRILPLLPSAALQLLGFVILWSLQVGLPVRLSVCQSVGLGQRELLVVLPVAVAMATHWHLMAHTAHVDLPHDVAASTLKISVSHSVPVELNWKWASASGSDAKVIGGEKLPKWGLRAWAFVLLAKVYVHDCVCLRALNARGSPQQSTEGKTLWPRETSPRTAGCSDDGPPWQH